MDTFDYTTEIIDSIKTYIEINNDLIVRLHSWSLANVFERISLLIQKIVFIF